MMTRPIGGQASGEPLETAEQLRHYVEELVGYASNPWQLAILFLDMQRRPLPPLVPFEHIPAIPSDDVLDDVLQQLMQSQGDGSVVFILERWGSHSVTGGDRNWATELATRATNVGQNVAAVLLRTPTAVRVVPLPD